MILYNMLLLLAILPLTLPLLVIVLTFIIKSKGDIHHD
jgi:hypothetical protein